MELTPVYYIGLVCHCRVSQMSLDNRHWTFCLLESRELCDTQCVLVRTTLKIHWPKNASSSSDILLKI